MKVSLSAEARRDLRDIGNYIAQDDPERAESFVLELSAKAADLGTMPNRFPLLARFTKAGIRRRKYGNYLILYVADAEEVNILRFFHGARDYEVLLEAGR